MKVVGLMLCLALFLAGCKEESAPTVPSETAIATEAFVVLNTEPEQIISQEMAMLEGFVVMQDGDVRHNAKSWMDFLEDCEAGENASVTIVQYTQGDGGSSYVRYDVTFDGNDYAVVFEKDGQTITEVSQALVIENGLCDDTGEPYDSYEAYILNNIVLYKDLIAEPDYEGVKEIFLHAKEGEPPVKSYTTPEELDGILQLLMTAEYVPCEPESYVYGMKLLMTNRDSKQLVVELDLNQGNYRYGMQTYAYGEVSDLFAVLGIEQWPDSVLAEFSEYLD